MRIEHMRIKNYRVLRDVTFKDLKPFTAVTGPNGSGKSTVFDAFAFLHEVFTAGLRGAWDKRNRVDAIRCRDSEGPIEFELKYSVDVDGQKRQTTYEITIDEESGQPAVQREVLRWTTARGSGRPRDISRFERENGKIYNEQTSWWRDAR